MTGIVLNPLQADDVSTIGKATIEMRRGQLHIELEGWRFEYASTCRESSTKALMYLRDVIDAQIRTQALVPGGTVVCSFD